jgi:hypothetical protein
MIFISIALWSLSGALIFLSLMESLYPEAWLKLVFRFLNNRLFSSFYGAAVFFFFLLLVSALIKTPVFTRFRFFIWTISFFLLMESMIVIFFKKLVRDSLTSLQEGTDPRAQIRFLYFDSFARMLAGLIIAASMI